MLLPLEGIVSVELLGDLRVVDYVGLAVLEAPVGVAALYFEVEGGLPLQRLGLIVLHHLRGNLAPL